MMHNSVIALNKIIRYPEPARKYRFFQLSGPRRRLQARPEYYGAIGLCYR